MIKNTNRTTIVCVLVFIVCINTGSFAASSNKHIELNSIQTLEEQLLYPNTIYEISSIVKLNSDFRIPDNCTLYFTGGSIEGSHKLFGENTQIRAGDYDVIFEGVICAGKWHCEKASICWWGAQDSYKIASNGHGFLADLACDKAIELCLQSSIPAVYFPIGCWYITKTIRVTSHKDFFLAGGPSIKSYYLKALVYDNNIQAATIYTDQNIKVFSICFSGEDVINISGGSLDVSQVFYKSNQVYDESAIYFDISNGSRIIQAFISTHMINYQDEDVFFKSNSRGVLFHVSGSIYSFAMGVTVECKINGFSTGIETLKDDDANKSSWVTDLQLNSYIRKARTAIKLPIGDGSHIGGSLQSTRFFDNEGGIKDKDNYPFVDVSCRFVRIDASIWDVHSQKSGKWSNSVAIIIRGKKNTCNIDESIIALYGPKKALILPQ